MNDDTLREKLKDITNNHSCYGCYDEMKSQRRKCPGLQRDQIALIHQYAQAYAESIIVPFVDGEDISLEDYAHNRLRKHQRTLNNERGGKL